LTSCSNSKGGTDRSDLGDIREQIDQIDERIQALIAERAGLAQAVRSAKGEVASPAEYYRPDREAQVLRRVIERNAGPLADSVMLRVFREIMSACLAQQEPLRVAYLGPEGTFTQQAVFRQFGHSVSASAETGIDEVFRRVQGGEVDFGVVPVENSTEGMINHTLDMFMSSPLKICGEVQLRIHHHLLVAPKHHDQEIQRIYSHQQSFAQCRQWLDTHRHGIERITVSSNAEAARRAAQEPGSAAIAGDMAAELYGLDTLASSIEDRPDNTTRFLIIGREEVPVSGHDKSSILVSMRNKPGALYQLLEPFHNHGLSLTRIETRPSPSGTWAYVFYIDFEGHYEDEQVKQVLEEIDEEAVELKRLGSYPIGVL